MLWSRHNSLGRARTKPTIRNANVTVGGHPSEFPTSELVRPTLQGSAGSRIVENVNNLSLSKNHCFCWLIFELSKREFAIR
jgi:hypothetical protein